MSALVDQVRARWSAAFSGDATAERLTDAELAAFEAADAATHAFFGGDDPYTSAVRRLVAEVRERRKLHEQAVEDIDALVRELERFSGPRCDGDHEPPACASVTCWRSPSPDLIAYWRERADRDAADTYVVDPEQIRWLLDLVERARRVRVDPPSAAPMSRDVLVGIAHRAAVEIERDPRRLRVVVAVTCAEGRWIGVGSNTSPADTHALLVSACRGAERNTHPELAKEPTP